MIKKPLAIPFDFVLEQLDGIVSAIRPMFGCYAIYVGEKLVLILRNRKEHATDNGVWMAILPEHYPGLKEIFPSLRPVHLLGDKATVWQNLPVEADDFEESVLLACDLIRKNDPRIGKVPKSRKKKSKGIRKR